MTEPRKNDADLVPAYAQPADDSAIQAPVPLVAPQSAIRNPKSAIENPPRWLTLPAAPMQPNTWQDDPNVRKALWSRLCSDVWLVECPMCGSQTYCHLSRSGRPVTCAFCEANCDDVIAEAYTVEDAIECGTRSPNCGMQSMEAQL